MHTAQKAEAQAAANAEADRLEAAARELFAKSNTLADEGRLFDAGEAHMKAVALQQQASRVLLNAA